MAIRQMTKKKIELTAENYFSVEANLDYFSNSQISKFEQCEEMALAYIKGEYEQEMTTSLLVGSFVDAVLTSDDGGYSFSEQHPEIINSRSGELKSDYRHALYIIERIKSDPLMMEFLSGEHQVIKTGKIGGFPFRIKMDSYHPGKAIVDLKIVKDFDTVYVPGSGHVNFVEAWNYIRQGAIYQAIEGNHLPFFLACATKQKPEPDKAILSIPQYAMDMEIDLLLRKIPRWHGIKDGVIKPTRCERCDWCKRTKQLSEIVVYDELYVEEGE